MWWFEKRRTFVVGVIVLVEVLGFQQGILSRDIAAVSADPIPFSVGRVPWSGGGESFRAKRESLEGSNSGGDGTKKSDVPSIATNSTGGGGVADQKLNASSAVGPTQTGTTKSVKEKTVNVRIPDRTPANITTAQIKEENQSDEEDEDLATKRPGQGDFDEKAVQRTIIVIAGIAVIVMTYLGIKFALIKRRKVVKRYGRVEASEMDLLDEIEDEESDEEEELFDINQQRRS